MLRIKLQELHFPPDTGQQDAVRAHHVSAQHWDPTTAAAAAGAGGVWTISEYIRVFIPCWRPKAIDLVIENECMAFLLSTELKLFTLQTWRHFLGVAVDLSKI